MSKFGPIRNPAEPLWIPYLNSKGLNIPVSAREWLFDTGSLTDRLVKTSRGAFQVQVLMQRFQKPRLSESMRLNLRQGQWALIREVILTCHGIPWIYARSVIPQSTIVGKTRGLRGLGNQPLGAALFKDPSMRRKVVDISKIPLSNIPSMVWNQIPTENATQENKTVWGRRSLFTVKGEALLVAEIFLPPVWAHQTENL